MAPPTQTVPDLLRERFAAEPGAVALVVDGGDTLTYEQWERRSNAVARGMVVHGVRPGDRMALLFDNARWTHYAVSYLAAHKAGAVAVPLGPRFAGPEIKAVLDHCEPAGVVGPADLVPADLVQAEGGRWTTGPGGLAAGQGDEPFQAALRPEDLSEIIYTSGTTGRPKGVAVSHENVLFHDAPPDPPDGGRAAFVHAFPVGTNAGQEVLRLPLRRGDRTAVVLPVFDPDRFCALVAEHRVRRLQLVPAMAEMLLASGAVARHDLSSLERVVLSSAPSPPALLERLARAVPQAAIWNTYALTEAGTARTLMVFDGTRAGSVGKGVGGTEVRVVDAADDAADDAVDDAVDVAAGEVGEVWLRRPGAPLRRYYRDPEADAAGFAGDWVRTGDLGYLDPDGYLFLVERKKDLIITGGLNVSSVEVENVLYDHPAVAEAAVFGIPHPVLGQDVAAAVVVGDGVSERDLQAFVRGRLAEHKVPHRVVFVDRLPRNPSGKVVKAELRQRFSAEAPADAGAGDVGPERAPRTATEGLVAAAWEEALGRDDFGLEEDFFALGGHSLSAAQVVARLNEALDADLPADAVFESPTVAELAAAVDARRRAGADG